MQNTKKKKEIKQNWIIFQGERRVYMKYSNEFCSHCSHAIMCLWLVLIFFLFDY